MSAPIPIASRRELFADGFLIESLTGSARLDLHHPEPREVSLVLDKPWEGNMSGAFTTVLKDAGCYRLYYKGWAMNLADGSHFHPLWICHAQSDDGIHWERSGGGHIEYEGSTDNNLVFAGVGPDQKGVHGFAPFRDVNPDADPEHPYKAVGAVRKAISDGLYALRSADGLRWELLHDQPVIPKDCGAFDSQNLAFWDGELGAYRAYFRDSRDGCRGIKTATSHDFIEWSTPQWLEYPGAPAEQLYTNMIQPYPRAPHLLVGFPARYVERSWSPAIEALPELDERCLRADKEERYGAAVTDGLFMAGRDGVTFKRWGEAFIRPGPQRAGNWCYGDNFQAWGMIETPSALEGAPPELSFYVSEHYWRDPASKIRRYTLRMDGFVSVSAGLDGGELVTKPVVFEGGRLEINFATSAAGSVRVAIERADGTPIEGLSLDDCVEQIGDELDRTVTWTGGADVSAVAGKAVRLRFRVADGDVYAFRFQ